MEVEEVIEYINHHLCEPLSVTQIAEHFGISRSYLSRLVKKSFNQSPKALLIEQKMLRASELLLNSGRSVEKISVSCGYSSASAFCHAFKNFYGTSPQLWREENTQLRFELKVLTKGKERE